ncbi:MAG: NAD(P)H-dependent oxidoreductase subunit E, partial [Microcystaceae cyanobacterium]
MDLLELREIAEQTRQNQPKIRIRCCNAAGCLSSQGQEVKDQLETAIASAGLANEVEVCGVGCMKFCGRGPLVAVDPVGSLYELVSPEQVTAIVEKLKNPDATPDNAPIVGDPHHPFYTLQRNIVLENSGQIDPDSIEDYIATGGYEQLYHVIYELTPENVVTEVTKSGLRGRGGGGYPTGLKWATVAKMPEGQKYVICNGDEGDPG